MSASIFKTISVLGTEIEFIKTFIGELTAHNNINCVTDIDEQFALESNTPQIVLNVGDTGQITITRNGALTSPSFQYIISGKIGNYVFDKSSSISFGSSQSSLSVANRTWKYTIIDNENVIFVAIYNHTADLSSSSLDCFSYLLCKTTNFNIATAYNDKISNTHIGNLSFATDEEISRSLTVKDRIAYDMPLGEIEIIKNKPFFSGTGKAFNFDGLYDCSKVGADIIITVESSNYYTLDTCTLIKVEV